MTRDWLNSLPDWVLVLIFIAVAVVVSLIGAAVVQRFFPRVRDPGSSDKVAGVAAMVMTLFALVLAFVIVNLYNSYDTASVDVGSEAASLGEIVLDARSFPAAERQRVDGAVAAYVNEVRGPEFELLKKGEEDPRARQRLYDTYGALQRYSPITTAQRTFYRSAADELNTVTALRNDRIEAAEANIPIPLLVLMLLLAVLTLATTVLINTHHVGLDLALLLSIAVVVGAGLVTAVILEYPFSGSIAVSSSPFHRGVLAQLPHTPG